MKIDVLSLFPEMFAGVFQSSILGKARAAGKVELNTINFRRFSTDKHQSVDDYPYGGGVGMVLKPEPIFAAVEHARQASAEQSSSSRIILMCPQGETFSQKKAEQLSHEQHLVVICGHYEGYDERIREHLVTDEISIGDYVLTGGEIPAMAVIDSVVRLLPGVLGNEQSAEADSFQEGRLEYPQYTRPAVFRDYPVPEILLSGHHQKIADWRKLQSVRRTMLRRPELLTRYPLNTEERKLIEHEPKDDKEGRGRKGS